MHMNSQNNHSASDSDVRNEPSSLGLLALAYGDSLDSEDEDCEVNNDPIEGCGTSKSDDFRYGDACEKTEAKINCRKEISYEFDRNNSSMIESNSLTNRFSRHQTEPQFDIPDSLTCKAVGTPRSGLAPRQPTTMPFVPRPDEDSSRLHVFCLQHAMQVCKRLSQLGGADVFLVCHPDYPKLESQAKKVAEELNSDYIWNEVSFREATDEDEEIVRRALESENAIHGNGNWAVKMGLNLFYSANLSRSPLYSKQMHYNSVIYNAFGRSSTTDRSTSEGELEGRVLGRQRKIIVAGKWCGKVWMSNQAHPLLVNKDSEEQEQEPAIASWTKPDVKYVRRSECSSLAAGKLSVVRKTSRKKTSNAESCSFMEEKSLEAEKSDKTRSFYCHKKIKRKHGSRMPKEDTPEVENQDESSEESQLQHGTKRLKKENLEDEYDSLEEEYPLSKSWKQIKSNLRARQKEKETSDANNLKKGKTEESNSHSVDEMEGGPSTRLRKRTKKPSKDSGARMTKPKPVVKKQQRDTTTKNTPAGKAPTSSNKGKTRDEEAEYACDFEGCAMSFCSKHELTLHKKNICPVKGCGKKFFSHKYLVQHRRVHMEDRPLKCPWKGCKMTFKWAWARTEHIRVHTGARPYVCTEAGCGQTFRFVSDFSRHKRKTGHAPKKARG